ncbi:MAG: SgcJ/EcaC family oxidoreductase [Deltaproteobacteria bacterium]|nr:SgcJ/EcaC family oxidoreductase [Deltaproteobacteria bacterium]MBI3386529.1 SgcJ/EcaC family oxidoreductase [Deltaproteobacteria bacterium]
MTLVTKSLCTATITLIALAVAAGASAKGHGSKTRAAIEAANQRFMVAAARGDATAIAALYTATGEVLPPNGETRSGTQALEAFWKAALDAGVKQAKLDTVEVEDCGDTAYEVGRYSMSGADGQAIDTGKYIVVWKRQRGQWKLHRDIWNSNRAVGAK